jgi:NAD(P)-dependent dehydrogenase (short-subunit alcohol dehydrogenase family)
VSRFEGRVAVVTGAAKGIGAAVARQLAADGATVACLDVAIDGAEKTAADLAETGASAAAYRCDVSDEASVAAAVVAVAADLGPPKVVCNVAGIGWFSHTIESTLDDWNRMIGVNLTGTFLVSRACLPFLIDGGGGSIVNIASSAGLVGQPYSAAYCASKGGVVMLTKALAWEYVRKGVRVNAVAPGGIETDILGGFMPPEGANLKLIGKLAMPMGFGQPEDVARVVAFLASDETSYLTGTVVPVDGGMTS